MTDCGVTNVIVQSFIIRIYRFDNERSQIAGTIQTPESETRLAFRGVDELWDALKVLVKQGQQESSRD